MATNDQAWWKECVVYQIYPRSFKDSNGDGVGDLRGIIGQLDYLQSLGIGAVWLNPIYESPNDDGGYDISDYRKILSELGTLADFDELVAGLHQRGIRLIMDIVVNHTSDEHPWFTASRKSKSNSYRNYYHWREGRDGQPPNNWPSFFGGSAWEQDDATRSYYLHLFGKKQPDLNWENPEVRREVVDIIKFWIDRGVDGLRLDVISAISKRTEFHDTDTTDFNETIRKFYANGPRLKAYLAELSEKLWKGTGILTVGEGPGITPGNAPDYLEPGRGLDMIFHFGHMFLDQGAGGRFDPVPWSLKDFVEVFATWDRAFATVGWPSLFLGNHDFPRMVSRWGDADRYWEKSIKLLHTLLLTMRGTPFIYQGDEIGMTNTRLATVRDSKDIETLNGWKVAKAKGVSEEAFLEKANYAGRDNARTPMAWNSSAGAGFSTGKPWMNVNPNNATINVASQEKDKTSVLNYFRRLIDLRKANKVLVYGAYQPLSAKVDSLFAYRRVWGEEKWLVVLNFSGTPVNFPENVSVSPSDRVLGNYDTLADHEELRPWEASVFRYDDKN